MINCEYSPANVQRKDIASKYFRHFFYISRLEITRSRGQVSRSRGQVFDLFPKDENRETEVSQRGFRFSFWVQRGQEVLRHHLRLLPHAGVRTWRESRLRLYVSARPQCEAVFPVRGGFLGDYGDGGEIIWVEYFYSVSFDYLCRCY